MKSGDAPGDSTGTISAAAGKRLDSGGLGKKTEPATCLPVSATPPHKLEAAAGREEAKAAPAQSKRGTLCLNVAAANDGRAVRLHEERTARVFLIHTETKDVELVE